LNEVAEVEIVPTPGFTYYKLKNYGIARSTTDLTIMLDSGRRSSAGVAGKSGQPLCRTRK
jgi:hypothetical protein